MKIKDYKKTIIIISVIFLIGLSNVTAYALSGEYRELLAKMLHINNA